MTAKKTDEVKTSEAIKETAPKSYFDVLSSVNCNGKTEKKNGLTYLSWAWAWQEFKKRLPYSYYTIYENENGLNYFTDGRTAWVKTGVTVVLTNVDGAKVDSLEHIEYLPIMDFKNNSIPLEKVTSFDVNKAIQRSLTKAVARHGLGLYIYAGEDLPEEETKAAPDSVAQPTKDQASTKPTTASKPSSVRKELVDFCSENQINLQVVAKMFKLNNSASEESFTKALQYCKAEVKKRILAEAQESKAEDSTVKDILDNAGKFLSGIEEV